MSDLFETASCYPHEGWSLAWNGVLEARQAGRVAVLGPPGHGKSSLLRALATHFSAGGEQVSFLNRGTAPDPGADVLIIDDADHWDEADLATAMPGFLIMAASPRFASRATAMSAVTVALQPFTLADVTSYLPLRLREAGLRMVKFSPDVPAALMAASAGAPRLLNGLIGSSALLAGLAGDDEITPEHVEEAAADFRPRPQSVALVVPPPEVKLPQQGRGAWGTAMLPLAVALAATLVTWTRPTQEALSPRQTLGMPGASNSLLLPVDMPPLVAALPGSNGDSVTSSPAPAGPPTGLAVITPHIPIPALPSDESTPSSPPPPSVDMRQFAVAALPVVAAPPSVAIVPSPPALDIAPDAIEGPPVVPMGGDEGSAGRDPPDTTEVPPDIQSMAAAGPPNPPPLPSEPSATPRTASLAPSMPPDGTRISLVVTYPSGDTGSARHAATLSDALSAAGWNVGQPFAVARGPSRPVLRYFYEDDQPHARRMAESLTQTQPILLLSGILPSAPLPRPGTLELSLPMSMVSKRDFAEAQAALLSGPSPPAPRMLGPQPMATVRGALVTFRWTGDQGQRASTLLEVMAFEESGEPREAHSSFLDGAQPYLLELRPGRYLWRVTALSRQARRYNAAPWASFTVEAVTP